MIINIIPNRFFSILIFCFLSINLSAQSLNESGNPRFRIVFYNVENLFDIYDDSLKLDNEFLPESVRLWDNRKFYKKLNNIYKVLINIGDWEPPAIIGLCETENRFVLNKLVYDTPLKKFGYRIIQEESPDKRGIDVAMIYRPDLFKPLVHKAIPVRFPFDTASRTRDILYVKGIVYTDTIHFFINHWPSKYGGLMATEPKRAYVAGILKSCTDSLFANSGSVKIFIMGDFNDCPSDESVSKFLQAKTDTSQIKLNELYNLMAGLYRTEGIGTHKYQGRWEILDQFIVSGSFLLNNTGVIISPTGAHIYHPPYLLTKDEKYTGEKPFRTFTGMKYNGGFSDHLPVYVDLVEVSPLMK